MPDPPNPDPEPNSILHIPSAEPGITTIAINRPHRRNAVDPPTAQKLYAAFLAFDADPTQKVCVFYGAEGTFCAGADLHVVSSSSSSSSSAPLPADAGQGADVIADGVFDSIPVSLTQRTRGPMGPSRLQLSKPVICAVSGHAVAGGLELSLLADMRVVEEDAVFGVYCRRWGIPLIDGGTVRLPAVVGLGRALDMILTGRGVGAEEALAFGLANRVVPRGEGVREAMRIARELVGFPQGCMNVDRGSCYRAVFGEGGLSEALRFEYQNGERVVREEGVQGAKRFHAGKGRGGRFDDHADAVKAKL